MEIVNGEPYLPGAASCLDQLDKRIMLVLKDGRNLVGTLRSFDHFLNFTLEKAVERIMNQDKYCDIPLGLYIVRGDNIVLYGEVDEELENKLEKVDSSKITIPNSNNTVEWDNDNAQ